MENVSEKKKVRMVFEFDRQDYEKVLFLTVANISDLHDAEAAWEAMTSEEIMINDAVFEVLGVSRRDTLALFVASAVLSVKNKVKAE